MKTTQRMLLLSVMIASPLLTAIQAQDGPYRVLHQIKIGDEDGWDYVVADGEARQASVPANQRQNPDARR